MPSPIARITLLALAVPFAVQAQATPPDLTDPEVAHVAVTANTIDVELARFAETRARNPEVRKFAATMITDHSAVNTMATALAGRLGVTPKDNAVSRSLLAGAAEARSELEKSRGADFERHYVAREVAYHQAVLEALDGLLIPTSQNADLRKLLTDVRPAIAAHLEHARMLLKSLGDAR